MIPLKTVDIIDLWHIAKGDFSCVHEEGYRFTYKLDRYMGPPHFMLISSDRGYEGSPYHESRNK